jgi:hypothetical protein
MVQDLDFFSAPKYPYPNTPCPLYFCGFLAFDETQAPVQKLRH